MLPRGHPLGRTLRLRAGTGAAGAGAAGAAGAGGSVSLRGAEEITGGDDERCWS